MNNRSIDVLVIFSAILATLCFFYSDANDSARDSDDGSIALVPLAQHAKTAEATHAGSWLGSPFGNGLPAKERVAAKPQHVLARQKKMESLGYGSPPAYYDMSLNTLKALAKKGDGDAMLQLAEQYSEEANFLASDPDYPKGEDLKMLAKQYLVDAVNAGYSRAAAILSKKHFEENNPVEAYAWKMMSEKLGDGNNSVWGKETNQFASLTEEQKQLANAKFASILEMDLAARARLRTPGQASR